MKSTADFWQNWFGPISGLAAMAIGLGKETSNHTAELITPILTCLTGLLFDNCSQCIWCSTPIADADSRVRYYACESLYNVVKVINAHLQSSAFFTNTFSQPCFKQVVYLYVNLDMCLLRCHGKRCFHCSMRCSPRSAVWWPTLIRMSRMAASCWTGCSKTSSLRARLLTLNPLFLLSGSGCTPGTGGLSSICHILSTNYINSSFC